MTEVEIEWITAGYIRSKRTGRWHAVLKDGTIQCLRLWSHHSSCLIRL
jgi:hypothetical protein